MVTLVRLKRLVNFDQPGTGGYHCKTPITLLPIHILYLYVRCYIRSSVYKRKNLEFQMLAAVYHKGDHGQYCYTLK